MNTTSENLQICLEDPCQKTKYNWPGWNLKDNQHGEEFDIAARERMIKGGAELVKYMDKFSAHMGVSILEIGPFFNPLTRFLENTLHQKSITFWENDPNVIEWLDQSQFAFSHQVKKVDVNGISHPEQEEQAFDNSFDSIIVSQIFNYIDYQEVLLVLNKHMRSQGLIFVNNVVDYGLPTFFSPKRPKSIGETLEQLENAGYEMLDYDILPTVYPEHQPQNRLVAVGRKN